MVIGLSKRASVDPESGSQDYLEAKSVPGPNLIIGQCSAYEMALLRPTTHCSCGKWACGSDDVPADIHAIQGLVVPLLCPRMFMLCKGLWFCESARSCTSVRPSGLVARDVPGGYFVN